MSAINRVNQTSRESFELGFAAAVEWLQRPIEGLEEATLRASVRLSVLRELRAEAAREYPELGDLDVIATQDDLDRVREAFGLPSLDELEVEP